MRAESNWFDAGDVALKGMTVKTHVYQVMPKDLERHFSVPILCNSSGGISSETASQLKAVAGTGDIKQMTMTQIASELRVLKAKCDSLLATKPAEDAKNKVLEPKDM